MIFSEIISEVSLTDILSTPTERKEVNEDHSNDFINQDDFSNDISHDDEFEDKPNREPQDEDEDYDAETEAKKLVSLLSAMNSLVVTPVANWKLRKNIGGKRTLERMKKAYTKKVSGQDLSENDEKLLSAFENYKNDMAILSGEIPYSENEIKTLNELAVPYLEETKMKINGSASFWTVFGGMQVSKIVKVLMA